MAGTINLSLQQQFDSRGLPLGGGKLYCFQSGTSTPQSAFKDIGLTIAHQNPVELDASGRVPQMFFADGTVKLRLTNRDGGVAGVKVPTQIKDTIARWQLGAGTKELARLFTDPALGQEFRRLADQPAGSGQAIITVLRLANIAHQMSKSSEEGQRPVGEDGH
jgi:hypothetical protein